MKCCSTNKHEVAKEAERASRRAAAAIAGVDARGEALNSSYRGGMRRAAADDSGCC